MSNRIEFEERNSAFRRRLQTFAVIDQTHIDIRDFLSNSFFYFEREINRILENEYLLKVAACIKLKFSKIVVSGGETVTENQTIYIHNISSVVDFETNLREFYDEMIQSYILQKVDDVVMKGSGFTLSEINELTTEVNQYDPIGGSSYIPLPKALQAKKAIINVKNKDNRCFQYALLSALFPVESNSHRVSNYIKHLNKFNFNNIEFPVSLKQISLFEEQNANISINIYTYDEIEVKIRTLRLTKVVKPNHIYLLMMTAGGDHGVKTHYCWIKNLSRLLSSQTSANKKQKFYCDRCLNHFMTNEKLQQHLLNCLQQNR